MDPGAIAIAAQWVGGSRLVRGRSAAAVALWGALSLTACGDPAQVAEGPSGRSAATDSPGYRISASGGTPATGPGDRYNSCERIWCLTHSENFAIDHFLEGHVGFVLHTQSRGDVFVPRPRATGPAFPDAARSALLLCGRHAHPWLLGSSGGRPIRHTGYNHALGYPRAHFSSYGTRLDPCCVNGLGSAFLHSSAGKQFRFHETSEFRKNPALGWQKPFAARVSVAR